MPYLSPMFFEYSLRLGWELQTPILISTSETDEAEAALEIHIWAWDVVRYKYKLYPVDGVGFSTWLLGICPPAFCS